MFKHLFNPLKQGKKSPCRTRFYFLPCLSKSTKCFPYFRFNCINILVVFLLLLTGCDASSTVTFGDQSFTVEIADTPAEQQKGLMFRTHLCETCGMLFDFHREQRIGMWMKDTPLSLDMLFIDGNKKVVYIAERTTPYSLETITTPIPVRYVLELNAGSVQKYTINIGDTMQ